MVFALLLGACAPGAAADERSPVPTAPPPTFPELSSSTLTEVRAAVDRPGPFEVLLVDDETALATDDRTWAVTVRREGGTWRVAEVAALG